MCGIANYANANFVCELVQQGMGVSEIATETSGGWQMLGKKNQNNNIKQKQ